MDLTLHQLRLLVAVTEQGTIAAAANVLGYTPSAISQQLAGLDKACGASVFARVGRNIQLTDVGRVLVEHARGLLAGAEEALAAVARVEAVVEGTVRVAAFESVASTLLPALLRNLRHHHPALELRSRQMDPDDGIAALARGDIDLAFTIDYPHAPIAERTDIAHWTIAHDRFHLVVADDDPLGSGPVDLGSLADRSFIASSPDMSCGRCVVTACRSAGFEPLIAHALDDYTTSLRLIAAGEGVALIPDLGLIHQPPGVRTVPLLTPVSRTIQLAVRAASVGRPTYLAVRDALVAVADEFALVTAPRAA